MVTSYMVHTSIRSYRLVQDEAHEPSMTRLPKLRGKHTLPFIWLEISKWGLLCLKTTVSMRLRDRNRWAA